jgi:hypothetical protein
VPQIRRRGPLAVETRLLGIQMRQVSMMAKMISIAMAPV